MPAAEFGGTVLTNFFTFTATVDPASIAAVTSADTTVTSTLVKTGDTIVPIPPAALLSGVGVVGCHTIVDGTSFKLRLVNASAGALDAASQTWTFLVFRK